PDGAAVRGTVAGGDGALSASARAVSQLRGSARHFDGWTQRLAAVHSGNVPVAGWAGGVSGLPRTEAHRPGRAGEVADFGTLAPAASPGSRADFHGRQCDCVPDRAAFPRA